MTNLYDWDAIEKSPEFSEYSDSDKRIIRREWFKQNIEDTQDFKSFSDDEKSLIKNEWFSSYGDTPDETITKQVEPVSPGYENMAAMGGDDPTMYTEPNGEPLVRSGQLKEGLKEIGKSGLEGVSAFARSGLTFQETLNKFVSPFVEKMTGVKVRPDLVAPLTESIGKPVSEKIEGISGSESLKLDPKMAPKNWLESLTRIVPQVVAQGGLSIISPSLGASTIGAQIAGGTYSSLVDQGVDKDKAALWGLANAAMQAPLEQLGINKAMKYFTQRGRILDLIGAVAEEAGTEFAQQFPDAFVNIFAVNPDKSLLDKTEEYIQRLPQTIKEGLYAGSLTAPFALIPGAANIAFGRQEGVQELHDAENVDEAIAGFEKATKSEQPDQFSFPETPTQEADKFDLEVSLRQQEAAAENAKNIQIKELQAANEKNFHELQNDPSYQQRVKNQQAFDLEAGQAARAEELSKMIAARREQNQAEIDATYGNRRDNIEAENELIKNQIAKDAYKAPSVQVAVDAATQESGGQFSREQIESEFAKRLPFKFPEQSKAEQDTILSEIKSQIAGKYQEGIKAKRIEQQRSISEFGTIDESASEIANESQSRTIPASLPADVSYKRSGNKYSVLDKSGKNVFGGKTFNSPGYAQKYYKEKLAEQRAKEIKRFEPKSIVAPVKKAENKQTEQVHDFASTQVNLDKDTVGKIKSFSSKIPDSEIYTKSGDDSYGRENNPHVTVRYGLKDADHAKIQEVVGSVPPIELEMGETSAFKNADTHDVLKVDVDSAGLRTLNKAIGDNFDLPGETFTDYKPHATIAYLKKGIVDKYTGSKEFAGKKVTIDKIYLSDEYGNETEFNLGANKQNPGIIDFKSEYEKKISDVIKERLKDETGSSQLITDISTHGANLIRSGFNTVARFTAKMHERFKSQWAKIKPHIEKIFEIAKEYAHKLATEQKGELNIDLNLFGRKLKERLNKKTGKSPVKVPKKSGASPGPVRDQSGTGPQKKYDWSRAKRQGGEVPENYYDEGWADRKGASDHAKDVLRSMKKDVGGGLEKYFGAISTRLAKIDPRLKYRLRKFEIETMKLKKQLSDDMAEIGIAAKKVMSKREFFDFDYARINGDAKKIDFFLNKYGLHEQFNKAKSVFEKLKTMAKDVGVEIGTVDNYWSRYVADADGFLKATGRMSGEWGEFHQAISEKALEMNMSLNEMSNEQKAKIISSMLLSGRSINAGIKSAKHRKLEIVPSELIKFYAPADAAAQQHVNAMLDAIGMRKMLGGKPKEIKAAENKVISAKNRIVELKNELKDPATKDNDKGAIENTIKEQEQILYSNQAKIDKFGMADDFTNHINDFILELMAKNEINESEANTLRDILLARFHQKGGPSGFWNFYKDFATIDTMGSFISTITNLQDFCWSMYDGGIIRGSKNALLALASKSKIKAKDIGFDEINQEFASSSSLKKFVNFVFKHIGFGYVDIAGKEALINSAFEKYSNMAKKSPDKLREKIKGIFENETDSVIEDLINGNVSDNVKILLANRVLDFQPAALSEMPEAYLQMKNGRIFYFLKSYTLKQFDVYRNEIFEEIGSGDKASVIQGMKNLYRISLLFTITGIGADALKDFILGRKTDFSDRFTDNLLRLAGVSKWVVWKARTEGIATASAKQILPPFKFLDALTKDVFSKNDGRGLETVSSIPFLGKMYYWHYGKGTGKRADLWDLRFKRQKDMLSWVEDEYEAAENKSAFKSEYREQIRRSKRIKAVQAEMNQYKRKINRLLKKEDSGENVAENIKRLRERRIQLIKRFLGE